LLGQDVEYDVFGEEAPIKNHNLTISVPAFYIDVFPVTIEQYSAYLSSAGLPADGRSCLNFLADWEWSWKEGSNCTTEAYCSCSNAAQLPTPPSDRLQSPVTWISPRESRAYCSSLGKRLPEEWEWQYAAQGGNPANVYPWGAQFDASRIPATTNARIPELPVDVHTFVNGSSPFGVSDLVGNAWEWTTEFHDLHMRRISVKGGSRFAIDSTSWYFPNTAKTNTHGNYLLMDDAMDRSGFIGFRCVMDVSHTMEVGVEEDDGSGTEELVSWS
jgi:iron(II)-dependent oxidoreductase